MGKSYFIETYGCQMNVADSELIAGLLHKQGYVVSKSMDNADAIFVNTCAIREHAEEKVHSRLGVYSQIKQNRPDVIIGVLGCMAQHLKDEILESKPYVDIILGPDSYRRLPVMLDRKIENTNSRLIQSYPVLRFMITFSRIDKAVSMPGYPLCVVATNFVRSALSHLPGAGKEVAVSLVLLLKFTKQ